METRDTDDNPFAIDTMGRCFLCLIKVEPEWESSKQKITSGSFQCLPRYLEVDLEDILLNKRRRYGKEIKLDVKLCEECTMVSEKLSELCQELGNCLKIIKNKLVKAEDTGLAGDVFRSSDSHGDKEEEIKPRRRGRPSKAQMQARPKRVNLEVVDKLRKDVIEKCSIKIRALLPPTPISTVEEVLPDGSEEDEDDTNDHFKSWHSSASNPVMELTTEQAQNSNCDVGSSKDPLSPDFMEPDDDFNEDLEGHEDSDSDFNSDEGSRKSAEVSSASEDSDDEEDNDNEGEDNEEQEIVPFGGGGGGDEERPYIRVAPPKPPGVDPKPQRMFNPETGKHQCSLCPKEFKDLKQFRGHHKTIHLHFRYKCISCEKQYKCRKSCKLHYQVAHGGLIIPKKCCCCEETFPGRAGLKEHHRNSECGEKMRRKRGGRAIKKEKLSCHICGKESTHWSRLKHHINTVHLKIRDIVCDQCGMGFSTPDHLQRHVKVVHLNLREHICEECGKGFNQARNLEVHQKTVHLKLKDHVCEQCGKGFALPELLRKHIQSIHLKGKEWACEDCGEKFNRKDYLVRHRRIVHKKEKRIVVNHGEKNKFVCPICGTGFTRNTDLTRHHNLIHLQLRPYPCNKCEMAFKWSKSLWRHRKKCHPETTGEVRGVEVPPPPAILPEGPEEEEVVATETELS